MFYNQFDEKKNVSVLSLLIINVEPGVGTGKRVETRKKTTERYTSPRVELRTGADNHRAKGPVAQFWLDPAGGRRAGGLAAGPPLTHRMRNKHRQMIDGRDT